MKKVKLELPYTYLETLYPNPGALQAAHIHLRGASGLLRSAAESLSHPGPHHHGESQSQPTDHEASRLIAYLTNHSLVLDADAVEQHLVAHKMKSGSEHRVAFLPPSHVIKVASVKSLATESLFDYLTDLILSNHCFADEIGILGAYARDGTHFVAIIQPYVDGVHPDWPALKFGLAKQGLLDPYPGSKGGNFTLRDPQIGGLDVYDLHVNNVIQDSNGWLHPIDAHFYFEDMHSRRSALTSLGLLSQQAS